MVLAIPQMARFGFWVFWKVLSMELNRQQQPFLAQAALPTHSVFDLDTLLYRSQRGSFFQSLLK